MSNNNYTSDLPQTNITGLPSRANKAWNFSFQTNSESFRKEVYHPDVAPENVLASADYEKSMSFSSPQSIIRASIEVVSIQEDNKPLKLKCGVIYRRNSMKLRDVVKRPDPIALLQEAAQIILRMEGCTQNMKQPVSHGCITPKLLFLDEGTGLLSLIGLNIKDLALRTGEKKWNEIVGLDLYTLAFRTPEKAASPLNKLDLLDDIYSLCLSLLHEYDPDSRKKPFGIDWGTLKSKEDVVKELQNIDRKKWVDSIIQKAQQEAFRPGSDDKSFKTKFREIMEKALNDNPACRYQNVTSFVNDCFRSKAPISMEKASSDLKRLNIPQKYLGDLIGLKASVLDGNSPAAIPIFITGPSGAGKTYMAKRIHEFIYDGSEQNFVRVDGAELSKDLAISALCGYKKGAFTGADQDRIGRIELARDGTLLFDEIQDMNLEIQGMLLKTLDPPHEFTPVGSTETSKKYARCLFIFCTNRNVHEMLKEGRIRQDFLNRIRDLRIEIPSVNERKEIFRNFLQSRFEEHRSTTARQLDAPTSLQLLNGRIDPEALELMVDAPNVGNFRSGEQYARLIVSTLINKIQPGKKPALEFTVADARNIIDNSITPDQLQRPIAQEELKERTKPPDAHAVFDKIVCVLRNNCRDCKPESVQSLSIDYVIGEAINLLKNEYGTLSRSWVANNVLKAIIRDKIISSRLSAQELKEKYGVASLDCELLKLWGRDRKKK